MAICCSLLTDSILFPHCQISFSLCCDNLNAPLPYPPFTPRESCLTPTSSIAQVPLSSLSIFPLPFVQYLTPCHYHCLEMCTSDRIFHLHFQSDELTHFGSAILDCLPLPRSAMDREMASRVFTRLTSKDSVLFVCDLQEKFRNNIIKFPEVVSVAARLVAAASTLEMPIIGTEQYPKGLGHLVPELNLPANTPIHDKTKFSMCIPAVEKILDPVPKSVILCGIEAHVCVLQTTLDLLEKGIAVHVVADATSSRSAVDRAFAFKQMERAGAILTTSECVILGLCGGSDHPKFKQIQKIIMESAPDTGISLAHI